MNIRNFSLSILMIGGLFASSAAVAVDLKTCARLLITRLGGGVAVGAIASVVENLSATRTFALPCYAQATVYYTAGLGAFIGCLEIVEAQTNENRAERKQEKAKLRQKLAAEKLADSKIE